MIKAILSKEWIKTKWVLILASLISTLLVAYVILRTYRAIDLKGIVHIWDVVLSRDALLIELLKFMPVLTGLLLAIVQYVPEMYQKRLKLTLHLAYSQTKMILLMLGFGLFCLLLLFLSNNIILFLAFNNVFAIEITSRILLTGLSWYLAGFASYLLTAWICFEPSWKARVLNALITVAFLRVFFLSDVPEAYNLFLAPLSLFVLMCVLLVFISIQHFRNGEQG